MQYFVAVSGLLLTTEYNGRCRNKYARKINTHQSYSLVFCEHVNVSPLAECVQKYSRRLTDQRLTVDRLTADPCWLMLCGLVLRAAPPDDKCPKFQIYKRTSEPVGHIM